MERRLLAKVKRGLSGPMGLYWVNFCLTFPLFTLTPLTQSCQIWRGNPSRGVEDFMVRPPRYPRGGAPPAGSQCSDCSAVVEGSPRRVPFWFDIRLQSALLGQNELAKKSSRTNLSRRKTTPTKLSCSRLRITTTVSKENNS